MRKILYITTVSRTINAFLIPHIKMLLANGYSVDCACHIDKPIDESLLNLGVKVYNVPFSRSPLDLGNIKAFKKLKKIVKDENYEVIHVHTPIAAIYGRLLKLSNKNLKTIYTAHGYHFLKGGSKIAWIIYYPIEKIMAKLTDVTININNEDYEITKNKLKPAECCLINGVGIDLSKYKKLSKEEILKIKKENNLDKDDFVILMIAELNRNKNQIQLIRAIEVLKKKYKNIKVLCVGEGNELSNLEEEVRIKSLQDNIKFLGFRNDINDLINCADIGILLSYREGLPRSIMEFLACGRKVIATNIRGCRDIIINEELGQLVEPGNYEETAGKIEEYYLWGDREFKIPNEVYKYDIEAINRKLLAVYDGLKYTNNNINKQYVLAENKIN